MKKIETIWHHILWLALEKRQYKNTQQALQQAFGYSLSTINLAVKQLAAIGAIDVQGKFFVVRDVKKILYYWATHRNLERSVIYQTRVEKPIGEIEGLVPAEAIFAGYTAAKQLLKSAPADYSKVYLYFNEAEIETVIKRFPQALGTANLIILKAYPKQLEYGAVTTLAQTFVDLWNLSDWYAKAYLTALEEKINHIIGDES